MKQTRQLNIIQKNRVVIVRNTNKILARKAIGKKHYMTIYEIINCVLDMVFPSRCAVCDQVLPWGQRDICLDCKANIQYLGNQVCFCCGKAVKEEEEYCYDCRRRKHDFDQGRALFTYEFIRPSLYRFKYAGRKEYARFYAKNIAKEFHSQTQIWQPQALLPVPIHPKRRKKRGYNQAEEIARELGQLWNLPVVTNLVYRTKNTRPMKEIVGTDRQNNLKKAFKLGTNDVKLNTIIIIDDIYTTGSTIDAVARECRKAGIENIYFITVSVGNGL